MSKGSNTQGNKLTLLAAIDGYREGRISMERAAELAGCSRAEFLAELPRRRVDVFVVDFEDRRQELAINGVNLTRPTDLPPRPGKVASKDLDS